VTLQFAMAPPRGGPRFRHGRQQDPDAAHAIDILQSSSLESAGVKHLY
jgi:hypothetical protein